MSKALIYCRYSPRPENECESIEFQSDFVSNYFSYLKIEVARVIADPDTSARMTPLHKRKGGIELLELTTGRRPAFKIVGAYRIDRLWRDVVDGNLSLKKWKKSGVACHFGAEGGQSLNTSTATGEFIINILLAKAQYEPALTSERTSAAMLRHMENNRAMGGTPRYGWREGASQVIGGETRRFWEADPAEQAIITRITGLSAEGLTLRQIASTLDSDGVPCRGSKWDKTTVGRIIKRAGVASQKV